MLYYTTLQKIKGEKRLLDMEGKGKIISLEGKAPLKLPITK